MASQRVVIFDFDGTLADTAPIIRGIYAELAPKNGWTPMTDKAYDLLRRGNIRQARKWSGIRWWQFPLVLRSAKRMIKLESSNVKLFPGMSDLVKELHGQDVELYVLSRNRSDTIERVLERYKLHRVLTIVRRRRRTLGSKAAAILELIRLHNYDPRHVVMVGDEVRDIQAARRAGVPCIAVTWGLQHQSVLKRYQPTHVVQTVDELRQVLQS